MIASFPALGSPAKRTGDGLRGSLAERVGLVARAMSAGTADVGVNLCGADVGMAQQYLDDTWVAESGIDILAQTPPGLTSCKNV